jgi:hypothetical protein
MYVISLLKNGVWTAWGSAASPRVINQYLELLTLLYPRFPIKVDSPHAVRSSFSS